MDPPSRTTSRTQTPLSRANTGNQQGGDSQPHVRLNVPPPLYRPGSAIRIQKITSNTNTTNDDASARSEASTAEPGSSRNRARSSSAPQRPQRALLPSWPSMRRLTSRNDAEGLDTVDEERAQGQPRQQRSTAYLSPGQEEQSTRPISPAISMGRKRAGSSAANSTISAEDYQPEVVDVLDLIDPEVQTLNTLNNVQNSLFLPNLGRLTRRTPTYTLSRPDEPEEELPPSKPLSLIPTLGRLRTTQTIEEASHEGSDTATPQTEKESLDAEGASSRPHLTHSTSLSSVLTGTGEGHHYAVLPHGATLEGWTAEDEAELNDHVRHMLHSRRSGFKRRMKAFGKYVQKPIGFLITLYAFLITFWGAAWVLFLIGWIYVGSRQAYFVEICDQVLTALFCVVGIGMSPFRAVDTYHMIYIAHYHYRVWKLRRERGLDQLKDVNDIPDTRPGGEPRDPDPEMALEKMEEEMVLTPEEQEKFRHHQEKFAKSHTFYKPHPTFTHHAFPVKLLITIVVLLDFHSFFQMALGGTTWGIYYKDRGRALTAIILSFSISCNISAGITISVGDRISRKKEVVEQLFRQQLTGTAMKKMNKKRPGLSLARKATDLNQPRLPVIKDEHEHEDHGNVETIEEEPNSATAKIPTIAVGNQDEDEKAGRLSTERWAQGVRSSMDEINRKQALKGAERAMAQKDAAARKSSGKEAFPDFEEQETAQNSEDEEESGAWTGGRRRRAGTGASQIGMVGEDVGPPEATGSGWRHRL